MITDKEREMLLAFITKHADGDTLLWTANRCASNITDMEDLRKFMMEYKPKTHPEDYLGASQMDRAELDKVKFIIEIDKPEDLGPTPKKLGANGQAIEKFMLRNPETDYSVDGLKQALHIPTAKIKPMLALLMERKRVKRTGNFTYRIVME